MVAKRGRKTALDLNLAVIPGGGRPEPPDGMPEDQAQVWRDVVGAMPPGWFGPQNRDVLSDCCRYACSTRVMGQQVMRAMRAVEASMTDKNLRTLNRLSVVSCRETMAMLAAATKLRLTPQGNVRKATAEAAIRNTVKTPRPWED